MAVTIPRRMVMRVRSDRRSLRHLKRGIVAGLLCAVASTAAIGAGDDHDDALAALQDVRAAVVEIERSADVSDSAPDRFLESGRRAINDVVGMSDPRYRRDSGGDGDMAGALGHLGRLVQRSRDAPWAAAITGAQVNASTAVARLQAAIAEHGMAQFQLDATDALADLEMALGRSSELGALGGISGALANTVLGVPSGARVVSGCDEPAVVPAYGVAAGYLMYVALPLQQGEARLPIDLGSSLIVANQDRLIAYTAAEKLRPALCGPVRDTMNGYPAHAGYAALTSAEQNSNAWLGGYLRRVAAHPNNTGAAPKLYTQSQAQAGKKIYHSKCSSCHGKDLQGTAAPSVAGKDFLQTAQANGWTLDDLRSIVFYNMPFNAPGSLSADQYADVMAYLLAENCYPAGDKPFPGTEDADFKTIPLQVMGDARKATQSKGTCEVK